MINILKSLFCSLEINPHTSNEKAYYPPVRWIPIGHLKNVVMLTQSLWKQIISSMESVKYHDKASDISASRNKWPDQMRQAPRCWFTWQCCRDVEDFVCLNSSNTQWTQNNVSAIPLTTISNNVHSCHSITTVLYIFCVYIMPLGPIWLLCS